jgi:hypothetical protein
MTVTWRPGMVHGWQGWWIVRGPLELGLVPQIGGRLMSMRWRAHELSFVHPDHAGRTLDVPAVTDVRQAKRDLGFIHWGGDKTWLAPQERWTDQVPFLDLDGGPYALDVEHAGPELVRIALRSAICRETGVRLVRTFTARADDADLVVEHVLQNASSTPVTWGPWDVQQLNAPGIAYLPRRAGSTFRDGVKAYPAEGDSEAARAHVVRLLDGVAAVDCRQRGWFKFGTDAADGWVLGVVETPSGLVGVRKSVTAVPGATYGHGCVVEVYNAPGYDYFELESHGPVVTLEPGERTVLVERRRVFDVPAWPANEREVRALG